MVSRWDYHPPMSASPIRRAVFERDLLIVSDECTRNDGADWPKLVWIIDNRTEENPVPIATCRCRRSNFCSARRALWRAQSVGELAEGELLEVGPHRLRHLLQRRP